MKKRIKYTLRLNEYEKHKIDQAHKMSSHTGPLSAFMRDLALGEIRHPYFDEEFQRITNQDLDVKAFGTIDGAYEARVHYHAIVLAALVVRVKKDPEFHKFIQDDPDMFNLIMDQIRGYKFDDKTGKKHPLKTD